MKPLEYTRILTGPVEDTRRVVSMVHPREWAGAPEKSAGGKEVYRVPGWRGVATELGTGLWNTEEVWGTDITSPFPGEEGPDWHVTRRDVCVDVESGAVPESWWREYFAGLRNRTRKVAQPGGGAIKVQDMGAGTGASIHSTDDTEYFGSRRAAAFFRIYVKYMRPGKGVKVRQCHLDAWTRAGWTQGAVLRVEAVLSPPTELAVTGGKMRRPVTPAELFADAAARVRLLEHPPERRGCDVPTAKRWEALGKPVKLTRPKDTAPDEAAARLARALERLAKEHGKAAVRLGAAMLRDA